MHLKRSDSSSSVGSVPSSRSDSSGASSHASSVSEQTCLSHVFVTNPGQSLPALVEYLNVQQVQLGDKCCLVVALQQKENLVQDAQLGLSICLSGALDQFSRAVGQQDSFRNWVRIDDHYITSSSPTANDVASSPLQTIEDELRKESQLQIAYSEALVVFAACDLRLILSLSVDVSTSVRSSKVLYLLERNPVSFPSLKPLDTTVAGVNPYGVPTCDEWRRLWAAWDMVTIQMIPEEMLHQKPIDLRHKCLFYIGHIPTFVNILLSKLLKEPYTEPKQFTQIFERGIDPHVDDPEYCHSHSEVPEKDEDWPSLPSILDYRDRIRARLMTLYDDVESGKRTMNRRIARVLQMTFEHEAFHVETLLYMLIQRAGTGTRPPSGLIIPPWDLLAEQWDRAPLPSSPTLTLGPATIVLGHDDSEPDDLVPEHTFDFDKHEFGWDNESPQRKVDVGQFRIDTRPVTNEEYYAFWKAQDGKLALPASWTKDGEDVLVRTVFGPVPLRVARLWPVQAAYDDLFTYAKSKGGRIPTEPELRLFLDTFEAGFDGSSNTGFRNWHPIPATMDHDRKGTNGGVWEWTSTVFVGHEGLAPTTIFPGYSSDFFDGKHQVVLGASYATIPRLGERRTLRNFYQHNYPYAWVGARIAYDV